MRLVRDQEAAGSNPVTPTKNQPGISPAGFLPECIGKEYAAEFARHNKNILLVRTLNTENHLDFMQTLYYPTVRRIIHAE